MKETRKSYRLRKERGDFELYLTGNGIDVGCGDDPLKVDSGSVVAFDLKDGNAQYLNGIPDLSFDFLYSSHCLEDLDDVEAGIANWSRVVKYGGYVYIVVPDYERYEKKTFPSKFNPYHRNTFSIDVKEDRANHYLVKKDLAIVLKRYGLTLISATLEDDGYDYERPNEDQTLKNALCQICIVAQKTKAIKTSLVFNDDALGGDMAILNSMYRYLMCIGYDVVVNSKSRVLDNIAYSKKPKYKNVVEFEPGVHEYGVRTIPQNLKKTVFESLAIKEADIYFPSVAFTKEECARIRNLLKHKCVNIFPYTGVLQKTIGEDSIRKIIDYLSKKHRLVSWAMPYKNGYDWSIFKNKHAQTEYFSRDFMIYVAGAYLNVSCDGGAMALANGLATRSLALMTYGSHVNEWSEKRIHREIQSTLDCSPCLRNYGKEISPCEHKADHCGKNFDIEKIFESIDDILSKPCLF